MFEYHAKDPKHRPTPEQAGFIVAAILDHMREGGSYRYLIYERMGFEPDAYAILQVAGALDISNLCPVKEPEQLPSICSLSLLTVEDVEMQNGNYYVCWTEGGVRHRSRWVSETPPRRGDRALQVTEMTAGSVIPCVRSVNDTYTFSSWGT